MADSNQQVCEEPRGQQQHGGAIAAVAAIMTMISRGVAAVFNAATRDGTLAAAFRQGAGEIGQALKAFPDSIQVHEPGTVLAPTQGEIAEARDVHAPLMIRCQARLPRTMPAPSMVSSSPLPRPHRRRSIPPKARQRPSTARSKAAFSRHPRQVTSPGATGRCSLRRSQRT